MSSLLEEILATGAEKFNLSLTGAQLRQFSRYAAELVAWNQRLNLTRIVDPAEIAVKHFLDSLSLVVVLPDRAAALRLVDVGTGAGFPGLPLKIALPHLRLTLVESTAKKTAFLRHMVELLNLPDVAVVPARAEEAGRQAEHRQQYDVAAARAVAALPTLAEYLLPLVRVGGLAVAAKGQNPAQEVAEARAALKLLGGQVDRVVPVSVPGLNAARHLVVIRKTAPTPARFPRRPGLPAKQPLR